MERMLLKKLYALDDIQVGIFEVESKIQYYIAVLIDGLNFEVWGKGKTPYEAIINASEKWSNSFGGFNPFREALRLRW
ncbi:hypothetical protein AFV1_ORF77 [Captovirus AFV1]|uniref:Uncharacterized protein ORF77 n=1 Tax=Acidianus filamentous virus 1 (isolate United States/Yellowstone) TaxID=654909 RepID=Y077_AFV1Y|nr:hypothetical protein AFV1_ORF77 [Captovirus AFV1]Q70LE2.1 RecName: Full=Uncharacterized protein ORF77 [Acidianus filamentous virus 1 (isolate Yellowstone)]CAD98938.1 hypothetical protein [Captovirus AFV1]